MTATDVYYTIHTKSNDSITVDFNVADINNLTRGESASFEFHLPNPNDDLQVDNTTLTVSSDTTIPSGASQTHKAVTIESGATLTVDGTLTTAELTVNGTLNGSGTVNVVDTVLSKTIALETAETYDEVTVAADTKLVVDGILQAKKITVDGEIEVNGTIRTIADRGFELLRQFDDYGGKYATIETLSSKTAYKDQRPNDHPIKTQAVGIEPSPKLKERNVIGLWALIDGVEDVRPRALSDTRVAVDVTILAEYGEYNNHSELEAELKA